MFLLRLLACALVVAISPMEKPSSAKPAPWLDVTFGFSQPVAATGAPPRLWVEVANLNDRPVPFMRFAGDRCFVQFYLQLRLRAPSGEVFVPASCPIRSWPGTASTLSPRAVERRALSLRELFPAARWGAGDYSVEATWDVGELGKRHKGVYAVPARVDFDPSTEGQRGPLFTLRPILAKLLLKKNEEVTLPDGARLTLQGHGHKRTRVGGPPSPLITYLSFAAPGEKPIQDLQVNVLIEESPVFSVGEDYFFEVLESRYDQSMTLSYFGQVDFR